MLRETATSGFWSALKARSTSIDGEPYVKQNVFTSLDPKSGRPEIDPAHKPGTGKSVDFCPSHWGGKDWPPYFVQPPNSNDLYPSQRESLRYFHCQTDKIYAHA